MSELEPLGLGFVIAALLAGGLVKGLIGIALPIVVIAILTTVYPVTEILALIVVPILATNLWQALQTSANPLGPLRRFWPLIASLVAFIWIFTQLVVALDPRVLYGAVGVVVVLFTVSSFVHPAARLPRKAETWAGPLAGMAGGILGGLSTMWGPPLTMYLVLLRLPKDEFISTVGLIWFAGSVPLVAGYVANGLLDGPAALRSALACLPAFAGLAAGSWLRGRIDQELFRKVLLAFLFLIGLNLLRRALF